MTQHLDHIVSLIEQHCGYGSKPTKVLLCSCGELFDIKRKSKKIRK